MANWPGDRERWSRRAPKRRQKKFNSLERAERFLEEVKREYFRRGGVSLAEDRELHYDFMRAAELIGDLPGARLETAAQILRMCRSPKEYRSGAFEVSKDRRVELNPRVYLFCQNAARERGLSLEGAVNGLLLSGMEREAEGWVRGRAEGEAEAKAERKREEERAAAAAKRTKREALRAKRVARREARKRRVQEEKELGGVFAALEKVVGEGKA